MIIKQQQQQQCKQVNRIGRGQGNDMKYTDSDCEKLQRLSTLHVSLIAAKSYNN